MYGLSLTLNVRLAFLELFALLLSYEKDLLDKELVGMHSLVPAGRCLVEVGIFAVVEYLPWTASDKDRYSMLDHHQDYIVVLPVLAEIAAA